MPNVALVQQTNSWFCASLSGPETDDSVVLDLCPASESSPMNLASSLSPALDEFAGICAVGALDTPAVEAISVGQFLLPKITGATYWDKTLYPIAIWAGDSDGGFVSADDMNAWLRLGEETMDLSGPFEQKIARIVPADALTHVMAAIFQASGMLQSANDALEPAETEDELNATLEQLQQIASESKSAIEYEGKALLAHTDLLFNCMVDLLGNMTVAESADAHLAFDVAAETLDPATGNKVKIKACWTRADDPAHQSTHTFRLGDMQCQAHDEDDFARMLAALPESSREHYRHTFTHLHQAADAVGEYAAGKVGEALAKASTVNEPLLHVDRHAITHKVHAEVVEELDPFVWEMSGEPGRGGQEDGHQH